MSQVLPRSTHILYISPNAYCGGAELFVFNICRLHKQRGEKATIAFLNQGELVEMAKNEKIPFISLPFKLRLRSPWKIIRAALTLRSFILRNHISVVHSTMAYSQILSGLSTVGLRGVRRIWFQHGPVGGLLDKLAGFFTCDFTIFNSKYLLDKHTQTPIFKQTATRVIKLANFQGAPSEYALLEILKKYRELNSGLIKFVIAGRITSFKGIREIIIQLEHAKKIITKDDLNRLQILIVGQASTPTDVQYYNEIRKIVSEFGLDGIITFPGSSQNLPLIIQQSHFLIHLPLSIEPFGMVMLEAMNNGTVVVTNGSGELGEYIVEKQTGLVLDKNPWQANQAFTEFLISLLKGEFSSEWAEKTAMNAYRKSVTDFSPNFTIQSLNELYE